MSMSPAAHITDLFFREEISRSCRDLAGSQSVLPIIDVRARRESVSLSRQSTKTRAFETGEFESPHSALKRSYSMNEMHQKNSNEADVSITSFIAGLDLEEELREELGLLYTDAAHIVLNRRNSVPG